MKYDKNNKNDKYDLYRYDLFVACYYNGFLVTSLTNYANNKIFRGLSKQDDFFTSFNERLYKDLRRAKGYTCELEKLTREDSGITLKTTLQNATTKTMKLRVWEYSHGENLYVLAQQGLTMRYKTYTIAKLKMILQVN